MFQNEISPYFKLALPNYILKSNLSETKATCHSCAMTRDKRGPRAKVVYKGNLKCCTFFPTIPNYSVGALIKNRDLYEDFYIDFKKRLFRRDYVLPIGIVPSLQYQVNFFNRKPNDFGQKEEFLCPYFNLKLQNCGIWLHRGSVCTTFFCKSDRGAKGQKFWQNLLNYLNYVEMALLEECLAMLDFSPKQVTELLSFINQKKATREQLEKGLSDDDFKRLWNGYHDEVEDFFLRCEKTVGQIERSSLQEIMGDYGKDLFVQVEKSFETMMSSC